MSSYIPEHSVGSGQAVGLVSIPAVDDDEHTVDPPQSGGSQLLFLVADVSLELTQEHSQGFQLAQCPSADHKRKKMRFFWLRPLLDR